MSDDFDYKSLASGYQGVVQSWECDALNHLNVSHHFGRLSDNSFFMRHNLGMSPRTLTKQNRGTVLLNDHARFHNEAPLGCMLIGRGAPVEIQERTMRTYQELRDADGNLVTSSCGTIGCFDLQARKLVPWEANTLKLAEAARIDLPAHTQPLRLPMAQGRQQVPDLATTKAQGFFRSGATGINSWECDQFEHMNSMFYIRRQTEAVPHFWKHLGIGHNTLAAANSSSVVGEMRVSFIGELRAGEMVETWSALRGVNEKNLIAEHRLYNVETGEISALSLVCAVYFDLNKRRARAWADTTRTTLESHVIA
ncbi:MAG: thioesterase [Alphaproteobacteria bacterium]|nr:thioesterase [Alphaproteobacteria bacterium]